MAGILTRSDLLRDIGKRYSGRCRDKCKQRTPEEIRQIAISLGMVINKHISLEMLLDKVLKRAEFLRKLSNSRKNRYLTRRWKKYLAFAEKR